MNIKTFGLSKVLYEGKSKHNGDLRVIKTLGMGTYIQAGGLTQSGGIVETIWKQIINKVKKEISVVNNVLILGLGGGTVAKLIRKNWPDAKITGIDIDSAMVELGKKYLGLNESGVEIKIGDAFELGKRLKTKGERFNLVVIDLYNGDKYPEKFETEEFINLVKSLLSKSGMVVFNHLYYGEKRPEAVKFGNKLKKKFSNVEWFYPEANLMFLCRR